MLLTNIKVPQEQVSFLQAVRQGLGREQGLFFPTSWPKLDIDTLLSMPLVARSSAILQALIGDELSATDVDAMVSKAFTFPAPLVSVADDVACLELFHGPTLAFKDFGGRFMAQALAKAQAGSKTTIVTATSGDTGAAVAHAFYRQPGVQVVILFPKGKISPLQEKLFTTLGENISTLAVNGDFDQCQALVKQVFDDQPLVQRLGINSANSINISRLFAQVCYYFDAIAQVPPAKRDQVVIAVPSGNFGNLTAGLIAKALGLPIKRMVAATNSNDTVPRYWRSGDWQPKTTVATLSNAMDVAAPNNWPRVEALLAQGVIQRDDIEAVMVDEDDTVLGVRQLNCLAGVVPAGVSADQARAGAFQNRLDAVVSNLTESNQNMSASRSRILDTDYASETTNMAKSQIISQAATAMLAQANQSAQSVLSLLK